MSSQLAGRITFYDSLSLSLTSSPTAMESDNTLPSLDTQMASEPPLTYELLRFYKDKLHRLQENTQSELLERLSILREFLQEHHDATGRLETQLHELQQENTNLSAEMEETVKQQLEVIGIMKENEALKEKVRTLTQLDGDPSDDDDDGNRLEEDAHTSPQIDLISTHYESLIAQLMSKFDTSQSHRLSERELSNSKIDTLTARCQRLETVVSESMKDIMDERRGRATLEERLKETEEELNVSVYEMRSQLEGFERDMGMGNMSKLSNVDEEGEVEENMLPEDGYFGVRPKTNGGAHEDEVEAMQCEIDDLRQALQDTEERLLNAEQTRREVEKQRDEAVQYCTTIKATCQHTETEREALLKKCRDLEARILDAEMSRDMAVAGREQEEELSENADRDCREAQDARDDAWNAKMHAEGQQRKAELERDDAIKTKDAAIQQKQQLEEQCKTLGDERDAALQAKAETEERLAAATTYADNTDSTLKKALAEIATRQTAVALQEGLVIERERNVSKQYEEMDTKIQDAEDHERMAHQRAGELDAELQGLKTEMQVLQGHHRTLQDKLREAQEQAASPDDELQKAMSELQAEKDRADALEKELLEVQEQADQAVGLWEEREAELVAEINEAVANQGELAEECESLREAAFEHARRETQITRRVEEAEAAVKTLEEKYLAAKEQQLLQADAAEQARQKELVYAQQKHEARQKAAAYEEQLQQQRAEAAEQSRQREAVYERQQQDTKQEHEAILRRVTKIAKDLEHRLQEVRQINAVAEAKVTSANAQLLASQDRIAVLEATPPPPPPAKLVDTTKILAALTRHKTEDDADLLSLKQHIIKIETIALQYAPLNDAGNKMLGAIEELKRNHVATQVKHKKRRKKETMLAAAIVA